MATTLAKSAFNYESPVMEYFVLLGDDVKIEPPRVWIQKVREQFSQQHHFGVVTLPDMTMPDFPTFPVLSRIHFEILGNLCPDEFINQDADPYLFELYRPFSAASFAIGVQLRNRIGGDEMNPARYERVHIKDWKYSILESGHERIRQYRRVHDIRGQAELVTLDVIVPSFRTPVTLLRRVASLPVPLGFSTRVIIILDDPSQGAIRDLLEKEFGPRVRVRVNHKNLGAPATRNRGMDESTATWILFLDDDIEPHPALLLAYGKVILENGHRAAGFVGTSHFPTALSVRAAGVEMSYLTYFWRVALKPDGGELAPWGVTANICVRRTKDRFDLQFPMTGYTPTLLSSDSI